MPAHRIRSQTWESPPRTRFSCFLTGPKQPTSARRRAIMDENGGGPFAMRRCQAALTSCARRLAATRSRPSRPPRSTKRLGSSASPRRSPIRPESGCPRNGRCVRSRRPRLRAGWGRRSPTLEDAGLLGKTSEAQLDGTALASELRGLLGLWATKTSPRKMQLRKRDNAGGYFSARLPPSTSRYVGPATGLTRGIQPFRGHPCRAYPLQTCLNEPN